MKKPNTQPVDHYRHVPKELRKRTPQPKFALKNPQLTATIAPNGFSFLIPGSFLQKPIITKKHKKEDIFDKLWKLIKKFLATHKLKFLYVFIGLLVIAGLLFFTMYYIPVQNMINATKKFGSSDFGETAQMEWANNVTSFRYINKPAPLQGATEGEFSKALLAYANSCVLFNKSNILKLPVVEIVDAKETQVDIDAPLLTVDDKLLVGASYDVAGRSFSFEKYMKCKVKVEETESPELNFLIAKVTSRLGDSTVKGTANPETALKNVNDVITPIKEAIKAQNLTDLQKYLTGTDYDQAGALMALDPTLKKIKDLSVFGSFKDTNQDSANPNQIHVGQLDATINGKTSLGQLKIYFDTINRTYLIDGLFNLIPKIPDPTAKPATTTTTTSQTNVTTLSCTDCWLAPVDKQHQLSNKYSPKVSGTGLNGGGNMVVQASAAMKELFAAAANEGINARIISAYRSYDEQVTTFNYWTNKTMSSNPGLSKAQAEEKANTFSARPGQSEHQLGTTADLKCASCGDFDNSAGNMKLYKFLEEHAYEYGFAISYANNTQQYTGYKYEAWHVRFIGKDLAKKFYETGYLNGNGEYLAKFLLEQNLY